MARYHRVSHLVDVCRALCFVSDMEAARVCPDSFTLCILLRSQVDHALVSSVFLTCERPFLTLHACRAVPKLERRPYPSTILPNIAITCFRARWLQLGEFGVGADARGRPKVGRCTVRGNGKEVTHTVQGAGKA